MGDVHDTVDEIVRRADFGEGDEPPEFEVVVTQTSTYYIRTGSAKKAVQAALEPGIVPDNEQLDVRVIELIETEDVDGEAQPEEDSSES